MPAFFFSVQSQVNNLTNSQTNYANLNTFVVSGRISNSEVVSSKNGEFLTVTVITHCMKDDEGMTITFNDSGSLMALFNKGFLPKGRMVTLSGHVARVSETYTDDKSGEVRLLKRPKMHLVDVSIPTGGLGPMPKDESAPRRAAGTVVVRPSDATKQQEPVVEEAPAF